MSGPWLTPEDISGKQVKVSGGVKQPSVVPTPATVLPSTQQAQQPTTQQGGWLDSSDIPGVQQTPDEPSIYSKALHVAGHLGEFIASAGTAPDILAAESQVHTGPKAFGQAFKDIMSLAGEASDAQRGVPNAQLMEQIQHAKDNFGSAISQDVSQFGEHPVDALAGVGYAITLKPLQDLFESGTGVSAETLKPLTPEDRTSAIKDLAGQAVAVGIGAGALKVIPTSGFISRIAASGAGGAAAGLGYGAVAKANTPDEVTNALSSAVIFSSFGAAHGLFTNVARGVLALKFKPPSDLASQLAHLQQLQADARSTLAEGVANEEALKSATNIHEAVLRGTLALDPEATHIIPSVPITEFSNLNDLINASKVPVITRTTTGVDGKSYIDMLFPGKKAVSVDMWKRTGFLPNQQVSFGGVDYSIVGEGRPLDRLGNTALILKHLDGNTTLEVPPDQVRTIPGRSFTSSAAVPELTTSIEPSQHTSILTQQDIDSYNNIIAPQIRDGVELHKAIENGSMSPDQARNMFALHNIFGGVDDPEALVRIANANGFIVAPRDGGYILKDSQYGGRIKTFSSAQDVMDFINQVGQQRGPELLDGGDGKGPPNIAAHMTNEQPENNFQAPWQPRPLDKLDRFFKGFNEATPWFTSKYDFLNSVDALSGTKFSTRVNIPIRDAWMKWMAQARPMMEKLQGVDKLLSKTSPARRAIIGGHLETMSEGEAHSESNVREQSEAQWLADKNVDIDKVYQYLRSTQEIMADYQKQIDKLSQGQQPNPGLQKILEGRAEEMKQAILAERDKLSPEEQEASVRFTQIKRQGLNTASLFKITRLARLIQNPEISLTADEYAAKHNMSGVELAASRQLQDMYKVLGDEFNIPDARRITQYMNHYRMYQEIPEDANLKPRNVLLSKDALAPGQFISDLVRSGEMNDYIFDPVNAMSRYIQSGYRARSGFNDIYANARLAAVEELKKLPAGNEAVAKVINEYLSEARGIPDAGRALMQDGFDHMMTALGIKTPINLKNDIVNGGLALTNSAMLGFKPELAFRDFSVGMKMYYARFGTARALNAFKYAFEADPETGMSAADHLVLQGKVPGLSPIDILSPEELARIQLGEDRTKWTTKMKLVAEKIGTLGLKVSGQQNFYAKLHAGVYLEASRLATRVLTDLAENNITKEQAYDKLGLDSYDAPISQRFDAMVSHGQFVDAADFLGRNTAIETGFIHGFGQHPYLWGTTPGRLLTQFGTWPTWARNYVARLVARGTPGNRIARVSRYIAAETATAMAGKAVGFNLRSWMITPNMFFAGGPLIRNAINTAAIFGTQGSQQQREAVGSLLNSFSTDGFKNMFVPGAYAFHDYVQAVKLAEEGYGAIPVLGKGLGFSIDETQRSFLDDWMGNYPETKTQPSLMDQIVRHYSPRQ